MNVSNLIGLTTQNKASDFLSKAIPSEPQPTLKDNVSSIQKESAVVSSATEDTEASTSSTTTTAQNTPSEQSEEFTTFLTLLTAQIKNQDPLAPLDSTQFVEQLATFSNLELQAEGNKVLEEIAQLLAQSLYNQNQVEA